MGKKLKRFLAMALAFIMFATCCEVPMTAKAADSIYAPYDIITYDDLLYYDNETSLPEGGMQLPKNDNTFKYVESEEASSTHSVIYRLRWTMGDSNYFQVHAATYGANSNFAYRMNFENWNDRGAGTNIAVSPTPTTGTSYDIEMARLMVVKGENAGKYYTYFKINGSILFEKYVAADDENTSKYLKNPDVATPKNTLYINVKNTTCSISATPEVEEDPNPDAPYYDYDEITYVDLMKDGNPVSSEGTKINGGNVFTYNATSPTYSAIFKFRWTAGSDTGIQFSFDKSGTNLMSYPFGVWVKKPNKDGAGENGAWHLKPTDGNLLVDMNTPVSQGDIFDIEIGRLKVKNGDPARIGQYYVYLKVNDVLIQETYSAVNADGTYKSGSTDCQLSNEIVFDDWGGFDNMISETPVPETFEEYDEITFDDLFLGDTSMNGQEIDGSQNYTYNATSSSYSMKLKFRWIAGETSKFTLFLDSSSQYPFCYAVKTPNQSDFGAAAGENGAWHLVPSDASLIKQMDTPIVVGQAYDIELGRLKVKTGTNTGKYYVYWKVNDELIQSYYYGGVADGTYGKEVSNIIKISAPEGNKFSAIPEPVTYEAYDEITYVDLKKNGNPVNSEGTKINGGNVFTYNATSPTYSAIFKFRWTAGTDTGIQFSFDKSGTNSMSYPFGVWVKKPNKDGAGENGAWHLKPTDGNLLVDMNTPVSQGDIFDIEIGRLKVKTGAPAHIGQYYVYLKVNDVLIQETYSTVNADGTYKSGSTDCQLSNEIVFDDWGAFDNMISETPVPETFEEYDEITFDDLFLGDTSMNGQEIDGSQNYTYNATSSTYSMKLKFRWIAGETSKFTLFLDSGSQYPFCYAVKTPNQSDFGAAAGENGAWHLVPSDASLIKQMDTPIVVGQAYDIELGRLKVKTGTNTGKYYVYWKVNGELIQSYYYSGVVNGVYDSIALSNNIIISSPTGNKFSAIVDPETYEDYDEITYVDLKKNGNPVNSEGTKINGGNVFTYNATSPTYSAIFKFRWTAGTDTGIQFSFDKSGTNSMSYPFGVWVKKPNKDGAGENGAWHLKPTDGNLLVGMNTPVSQGDIFDIEIGRLKVKTGAPAHIGQYYVYLKVNDVLIQETYSTVNADGTYKSGSTDCQLSNEIVFDDWGAFDNMISETPVPETYEDYDEITYVDLKKNGNPVNSEGTKINGGNVFTYNATSPTYSAIFKFRWTAGTDTGIQFSFDKSGTNSMSYPFGVWVKKPNKDGAGENGAWHLKPTDGNLLVDMNTPVSQGDIFDIEIGRLKVKTGDPAHIGQYYVYLKVNDVLIQETYSSVNADGTYKSGSTDCQLSNEIVFDDWGGFDNMIGEISEPETYEAYDEIGYEDLTEENGDPLGSQRLLSGGTVLKYNKTSATGSVIFKYRWKVGEKAKFQLSFEKTASNAMAYMFGAWLSAPGEEANYPNGRMWLRPGYNGPQVNLSSALESGKSYNVEFARLKVKTGRNTGKYYVYIKLDGVLIAEDYVAADVVDSNGNYTSNPGSTACTISNEIFLAFWNSEGNIISPYRALGADEHEGVLGDFDNDGAVSESDIILVRKLLAGKMNLNDLPEGIADFNNDGSVDSRDLVAIKKYFLPYVNNYEKSGSLTLGLQEHLLEDNTKTATYIADATATMGGNAYRLSRPIHSLFYVTSSNGVAVKEENMAAFREMVNALKAKGITEILYVTDSFLLPWDYSDPTVNHNETVPNPATEPEEYIGWLTVNAAAFKAIAEEFPEIKFFEPYNEVNLPDNVLEKPGIPWDEEDEELIAAHTYTVEEKAAIMADLCWYITRAVRSVDIRNQVTSPSIAVGTNSIIQTDFMDKFYDAIESGNYPTGNAVADTKVDNYFTIVNVHAYADYDSSTFGTNQQSNVNTWANKLKAVYNVVKEHNDGGSRVWLTETGMSTYHPDGKKRDESRVANMVDLTLKKLDQELTFIDTVIFYEVADMSWANYPSRNSETNFGLFYAGDDSSNAYKAKAIAKKIYSFFHNGSTDYSALEALANRYK